MPKNILIFSDGTGQAGGLRPDQRLSNIYKLYRATRIGPESAIDPSQQVAFYFQGLGSKEIDGPAWLQPISLAKKIMNSAAGTELMNNVADCYEVILKVYEPGDRIYLFGFSRGAYTVRSLAGVMNLCGVPTKLPDGTCLPRSGKILRAVADEAVHKVYEHGAGHPREKYEEEREEQARRFRKKYGTEDDPETNARGDVVPYFIGVFDTVAALGVSGLKRAAYIGGAVLLGATASAGIGGLISTLFDTRYWWTFGAVAALLAGSILGYAYYHRRKVIRDFPNPGDVSRHRAAWRFEHYDRFLDPRVRYARHAQAIDETRSTFSRVAWGGRKDQAAASPDWLIQKWFAGNHSDIGGSYPETESRLSDIALQWMVDEVMKIPYPILLDASKLNLFPDFRGVQHCEVANVLEMYPSWWPTRLRRSWKQKPRPSIPLDACHSTVRDRLGLEGVLQAGRYGPYRPESLKADSEAAKLYR